MGATLQLIGSNPTLTIFGGKVTMRNFSVQMIFKKSDVS